MKILTKYLVKEYYSTTAAAASILFLIFLSHQLVRFMRSIAFGSIPGSSLATILLLQIPILAAIIIPAALFLGILIAYGRLYADSEMLILSACGLNPTKLLRLNLCYSLVPIILVAILALWVNPKIYGYFNQLTSGNSAIEMLKPKHFNEILGGTWVLYVNNISKDRAHFYNIFAAQQPSQSKQKLSTIIAKSAYHKVDPANRKGDSYLVLENGYRYQGQVGERAYEIIKFKEYGIRIREKKIWQDKESNMSSQILWQQRHLSKIAAELQWRISLPLLAIILILLATPLSKIPPRKNRHHQLLPAVSLYIIYINGLFLARSWLKKGLISPKLGMWWIHGIMFALALFLLIRQRGRSAQ